MSKNWRGKEEVFLLVKDEFDFIEGTFIDSRVYGVFSTKEKAEEIKKEIEKCKPEKHGIKMVIISHEIDNTDYAKTIVQSING